MNGDVHKEKRVAKRRMISGKYVTEYEASGDPSARPPLHRRPAFNVDGAIERVFLLRRAHLHTFHEDHPLLDVSLVR